MSILDVTGVSKSFGGVKANVDISMSVEQGSIVGLIGPNGSGKTTLFNSIVGTYPIDKGSIKFDGKEVSELPVPVVAKLGLLRTFQQTRIYGKLNCIENMLISNKPANDGILTVFQKIPSDLTDKAETLLKFVGLHQKRKLRAGDLSFGQQKLLELAMALMNEPKMLLLDEPTNNLDINSIRWLEGVLSARKSTMVIISHDRHFLNGVCTHMADLDYGALNVFPGSYDDFMVAATAIQERMRSDNAKKEEKIKDLKHFVSRFSANASKSKQATSRLKQLNKIELDDIKPSSRVSPYIIFNQNKELFRNVLEVQGLNKSFDDEQVLKDINIMIETGERVAIIGQNGIGKSTLLKTIFGEIEPDGGITKWSENSNIGYYAQDHNEEFEKDMNVLDWMTQFKNEKDDIQVMRSVLGKMLFGKEDVKKSVKSLSGGEKGRMIFGRLMLQKPNILLMDEPTNHLDMESIEALNLALDNYKGTLVFVSHDREFVSSLSTKVIELKDDGAHYYSGNYEDYLLTQV